MAEFHDKQYMRKNWSWDHPVVGTRILRWVQHLQEYSGNGVDFHVNYASAGLTILKSQILVMSTLHSTA